MDISSSFQDPALCRALLDRLKDELDALGRPVSARCCQRGSSIFPDRDVLSV